MKCSAHFCINNLDDETLNNKLSNYAQHLNDKVEYDNEIFFIAMKLHNVHSIYKTTDM